MAKVRKSALKVKIEFYLPVDLTDSASVVKASALAESVRDAAGEAGSLVSYSSTFGNVEVEPNASTSVESE